MVVNEGNTLLEGPGLPRELQSASDLDSSRGPSSDLETIDYSWHGKAACNDIDTYKFYVGRGHKVNQEVSDACATCPVKDECLQHALEYEDYGYWAGTNPVQRSKMRRQLGIRLKPVSYDVIEKQKENASQSLTHTSLSAIISSEQLASDFYYPDEMSFEEMFYE